jgi:hypothetical protein
VTGKLCGWRRRRYKALAETFLVIALAFVLAVSAQKAALAQSRTLTSPQTVAGLTFAIRAASLQMIPPGAGNGPLPTARFSIAITNASKSSIGLIVEPQPSGASTDSGLDLKVLNGSIARGFTACSGPCTNIPDAEWTVLQPNQTDNIIIGFSAYVREPQRHRNAENVDLTLFLLVKQAGQAPARATLSWADIPVRNELQ